MNTRGLYIPIEQLPFPEVKNPEELVNEINKNKEYDDNDFIKKYCTYDEPNAAKHICEYLILNKNSKNIKIVEPRKNDKENVLIYAGNFAKNGLTMSFLNLINNIDLQKRNYCICFKEDKQSAKHTLTIANLPQDTNYISMSGATVYSILEIIAYIMFYKLNISNKFTKKYLDRLYKREIFRYFYDSNFLHVIHFSGYGKRTIGLIQRFNCNKTIYVHSDMLKEAKKKETNII